MTLFSDKFKRTLLGSLLALVALNALGGGLYGILGAEGVPPELLEGSPFSSYLIPSLFLFFVIGGTFIYASVAVFRRFRSARALSIFSSLLLICWLAIQVAIIGYATWVQPATLAAAVAILLLALFMRPQEDY